ncbi:MAG: hypothetical protein JWM33_1868 [Caulobacteraceae bacterium]|nr:hypothetical protein [Caulobacteraceae bacterium]
MAEQNDKPLSTLVSQGWEIIGFSGGVDSSTNYTDSVLLRRLKQHKILKIRKKFLGGVAVSELDL